jgi:hypothetical protein
MGQRHIQRSETYTKVRDKYTTRKNTRIGDTHAIFINTHDEFEVICWDRERSCEVLELYVLF